MNLGDLLGQALIGLIGVAGVLFGVLLTGVHEKRREAARFERDESAREADYRRRRRDKFEEALAEFLPFVHEWARLVVQTVPEVCAVVPLRYSDARSLDEAEAEMERLLSVMQVLSPSEPFTELLNDVQEELNSASFARAYEAQFESSNFGTEGERLEAKQDVAASVDSVENAVEMLVKVNSLEVRGLGLPVDERRS